MLVLRAIRDNDFAGLVALARTIDGTLTTLPPDEEFLRDRVDEAVRAFRPGVKRPGGEFYLFVLERLDTGEVVGTSGIASRVGGFDPFYSYEIRRERFVHAPLKIAKEIAVLHLKEVHRGPSEICSLYLRADCRRAGAGRLLSLSRFVFMAAFPMRFDATVIAEMRGYIDQEGRSPFWESVGRHFFEHDFYQADALAGIGNKAFIADLMPRHPIYVPLLPPAVQAVIGRVHHDTEPALSMLLAEGFQPTNEVDIFDAGPQLRAELAAVRTVRDVRNATIAAVEDDLAGQPHLLANGRIDFRACIGAVTTQESGVALTRATCAALHLQLGDRVWYAPLKPKS
jgi:arginine N-succinyltransferase